MLNLEPLRPLPFNGVNMKTESTTKRFIFAITLAAGLLVANIGITGLPPTTLNGWLDSVKNTTFNFFVPNKQATKVAGGTLIETGNKNRLINPGFEHSVYNTGWITPLPTGTASQTVGVDTASPIEGKKSLTFQCNGGASGGTCTVYQDATTSHALQGLASIYVQSDSASGVQVLPRVNEVETTLIVDVQSTKPSLVKIPVVLGTTHTGIAVKITAAASQVINVELDEAFVGAVDLKQDVDQSRIAGESYFAETVNCIWDRSSATLGAFTADVDCPGPTIARSTMGQWQTTDSDLPRQIINNLPAGTYKVTFIAPFFVTVGPRDSEAAITDGTTVCHPQKANDDERAGAGISVSCIFEYSAPGNRSFELYGSVSADSIRIGGGSTKFILEYFGSGSVYTSTNADTDWQSCGLTASDFTGFGTPANVDLSCKRRGSHLDIRGTFQTGTTSATEARINLKFQGKSLAIKAAHSRVQIFGGWWRNTNTGSVPKRGVAIGDANQTYLKFSLDDYTNGIDPFTAQNGSTIFGSAAFYGFDISVPIAEWQNSNVIIGQFNEMITTPGVTKPIRFSADVGSAGALSNIKGGNISSCSCNLGTMTCSLTGLASIPNCNVDYAGTGFGFMTLRQDLATSSNLSWVFRDANGTGVCDRAVVTCDGDMP